MQNDSDFNQLLDMAKRAAWTAFQAGLAVLVAAPVATDADGLRTLVYAAGVAALASGLSVVKSYIAQKLGT
jgi:hypothetical protein